jgi:hypothetical protein
MRRFSAPGGYFSLLRLIHRGEATVAGATWFFCP